MNAISYYIHGEFSFELEEKFGAKIYNYLNMLIEDFRKFGSHVKFLLMFYICNWKILFIISYIFIIRQVELL